MTTVASMIQQEAARLEALHSYALLDTPPEPDFDDLARLAALICGTPIALVSLVDSTRQWFKARMGLDISETPRDIAFCAHAITGAELFVIPDALTDDRFADNPLVTSDPSIRFYAGAPLVDPTGAALGTICVIDRVARTLSNEQLEALAALSRQAVSQMALRRHSRLLALEMQARERAQRDRDRLQNKLRQLQRLQAVQTLATGLAHEIDAPMQVIAENLRFAERCADLLLPLVREAGEESPAGSALEALFNQADLPFLQTQLPRAFQRCDEAASRVERVVTVMKRFSGTPGERTAADLNQCLRDTLVICQQHYKFVADLVTDFGELPPIEMNSSDIQQVFQSLIVNAAQAIEHTGRRGRIDVRSAISGDSALIRIEDNGCGIDNSIRDRIFEPFFSPRSDRLSSGQSLAVAHSIIVRSHGGSLDFETVAGVGTRFTVRLPLTAPPIETPAETLPGEPA